MVESSRKNLLLWALRSHIPDHLHFFLQQPPSGKRKQICYIACSFCIIYTKQNLFTAQMKGRWESNINVWFPFMYSQKWNCYFQNRIIMFCLLVPTLIYLWEIYIFPGSVYLFCCRKVYGSILGTYKSITDTWMWKLGLRPRNSQKRNT